MRIGIVSDFQLSNRFTDQDWVDLPEADVVVVAGDHFPGLCRSLSHLEALSRRNGRDQRVVYVAGNRDFYGVDHGWAMEQARALDLRNVRFLQDESVVIDGVRFAGATLWTDYGLEGGLSACRDAVARSVSDHSVIRNGAGWWTPEDALRSHVASRAFFEATLMDSDEPVVLVSHHAPSPLSSSLVHKDLHGVFASDLSDLMLGNHAPVLWAHGATHRAVDYSVGRTRVVSNPRGYYNEQTGFVEDLVVEIEVRPYSSSDAAP